MQQTARAVHHLGSFSAISLVGGRGEVQAKWKVIEVRGLGCGYRRNARNYLSGFQLREDEREL